MLYQERNVLFTSGAVAAKPLARSGTRKTTAGRGPTLPLVNVSAPFAVALPAPNAVFEPGSLLAKRGDV